MNKSVYITIGSLVVSLAIAIGAGPIMAKDVAPSYVEDPGVYKLISENEDFRVIMATWKPGQRDAWHSHAGAATSYRLTDCTMLAHTPDGKTVSRDGKRGEVKFNPVITSHSLENVGTTECQVLIVEKK
jgi:mannose-6-phosphate isomerase-like protein (cupin superfamily)